MASPARTPDLPPAVGARFELTVGNVAAGGGCVGRAPDGRVVFVRHSLPGERVVAEVTATTASYLRADAVEVLDPSSDRVAPPCRLAGPGRCGGCDFQHVAPAAQRRLKAELVADQLRRLAGLDRPLVVEPVGGGDVLHWRTRVRFAVDRQGRLGLLRHRSHELEVVDHCPVATGEVAATGVGGLRWPGCGTVEVTAPPGVDAVVRVATGPPRPPGRARSGPAGPPSVTAASTNLPTAEVSAGVVVDGRTVRRPAAVCFDVDGRRFTVSHGVFWQAHRDGAVALTRAVLAALQPRTGDRVTDLYAGAGLFTVPLAAAVGPTGEVLAVERSPQACADARRNAAAARRRDPACAPVAVRSAAVDAALVRGDLGRPDLVVLDPPRRGAGEQVMAALTALGPPLRRIVSVSCDPATFARDLRTALEAGWELTGLRVLDLFPMTEHVELVAALDPGRRTARVGRSGGPTRRTGPGGAAPPASVDGRPGGRDGLHEG